MLKQITALLVASTFALPAFGASDEDSSAPKPTQEAQDCKKDQVYDAKKKKCVKIEDSKLQGDALYNAARELAYLGRYEASLALLETSTTPNAPRILTYKGFANRRAGNLELGMGFYRQALAIDPTFILARSYMGQGLLKSGDIQGARRELIQIASIAGADNWAYQALAAALRGEDTDY